jgi:ADP-ribose pyrophosphatase YjhB (NUDIX family)
MPGSRKTIRVAVDVIIEMAGGDIVLIRRGNPPPGWASPVASSITGRH